MDIIELTQEDFEQKTRGGIVVVLLYSGVTLRDPKGLLGPAANHTYSDDVKFMMIDAGRYPEVAERLGVTGLPAALFLRNGMQKNLLQNVTDPQKILEASEANACYSCAMTRKRTAQRRKRRY